MRPDSMQPAAKRAGDDLLAVGVSRFLSAAIYEESPSGYGRIRRTIESGRLLPDVPMEWLRTNGQCVETVDPFRSFAFVDIESLGFLGRPLFLIGTLVGRRDGVGEIVQYLARDYSEERAVLAAFLDETQATELWVTFNGRSFDLPFIRLRADFYRLPAPEPRAHLDLLPVARRLWAKRLPNCRLATLEQHVCGRPRGPDLPGGRVPDAYHAFVRTGEPGQMIEILRHNGSDLIGLFDLLHTAVAERMRKAGE